MTKANVVVSSADLIISQFLDLVCDPGVVFFTPAFPTYWAAAAHIGIELKAVELDPVGGFLLTEADITKAVPLKPKAIIVNSANNPTGAVYSRGALDLLARKCDHNGIWLPSDETYGSIAFGKDFYSLGLQYATSCGDVFLLKAVFGAGLQSWLRSRPSKCREEADVVHFYAHFLSADLHAARMRCCNS